MSIKPKIEVVIRNRDQWDRYKARWDEHDWENDPRKISNSRFVRRKTRDQNSGYRVLIRKLANHIGEDPEHLHDQFIEAFGVLEDVENEITGETITRYKSTSEYDIEEMSALIDRILYVAANHFDFPMELEDK